MKTLYSEKTAEKKRQSSKTSTIIASVGAALALISGTLLMVFATYEKRTLFMVAGSIATSLFALVAIFFFIRRKYQKDESFLYEEILSSKSTLIKGRVVSIDEEPITLADSSYVYPTVIETGEKKLSLYLPYFVTEKPLVGEEYSFDVVSDRIRGYEPL